MKKQIDDIRRKIILQNTLEILPPVCFGLSIVFIIYSLGHYFLLDPEIAQILSLTTFFTAWFFAGIFLYLKLTKTRGIAQKYAFQRIQLAHLISGILLIFNSWLMMYLSHEPQQTTSFMLVQIGFATILTEIGIFAILNGILISSWMYLALPEMQSREMVHFAFAMLSSAALSLIIFAFRRNYSFILANIQNRDSNRQTELLMTSKMAALGEMASGIAHEVNNPLMIIIARLTQIDDQFRAGTLSREKISESLIVIEATISRITRIIRSLKSFARQSQNDPMISASLPELIDETLSFCREMLKSKNISFKSQEVPSIVLECRPSEISQVLLNLLNNAADAVDNEKDKRVSISFYIFRDKLQLAVSDSGQGVPFEIEDKIMEPFFTTKPVGQGSGLGLSISKGIAEAHNGRLFLDRRKSETTFVLEVPINNK